MVKRMTSFKAVAEKALFAGFVADAATLPLHWHYDTNKLKELLGEEGIQKPEFRDPPMTQFYKAEDFPGHYNVGQLSCYSEQSVMLLEYLQETKGKFEGGESFAQFMYQWFKKYTGRLDHPTKEFLEKAEKLLEEGKPLFPEAGADDTQTMHTFKTPVLTMKFADDPNYLTYVDQAVRAHQNTDRVGHFAHAMALMTKDLFSGTAFAASVENMLGNEDVADEVKEAFNWAWERKSKANIDEKGWDSDLQQFGVSLSHWLYEKYGGNEKFKDMMGLTCNFPGAYMTAMKIIGDTLETIPEDELKNEGFRFAIRRNILYGGDNCGRSFMIGTMLSAIGCDVPESFLASFTEADKLMPLIRTVSSL